MSSYTKHIVVLAILACCTSGLFAADSTPSQRLATELIRAATLRTAVEPLSMNALDAAVLLTRQAVELDPDNTELWTIALDVALLAEDETLKTQAIDKLSRLDPANEPVRLMRLNAAIERFQTFEERADAYERLLADDNLARIGHAVASRLALDFALLHQRQGDMRQFGKWLTKAVTWDASNRSAAAIATGFFRMNVQDPVADAELLVNLMIADPTDVTTQVALAQLLLEHGAFIGAERMYRLAANSTFADQSLPTNNLLIDQVIAQWAHGKNDTALGTLQERYSQLEAVYRYKMKQENPDLSTAELKNLPVPIDPSMATVEAVIRATSGDGMTSSSADAAASVVSAYETIIEAIKENAARPVAEGQPAISLNPVEMAQLYLQMAWVGLWLGGEVAHAEASLATAEELQPLSDEAKQRFDGWIAYRRGQLEQAIELLEPIAAKDIAARIGLALALQQQGKSRDAALQFLAANREQPGTLIGIWAAHQLKDLLGQRVPAPKHAAAMERVIASVPLQFDECASDSSKAIGLRITPAKLTHDAYEPIMFNIEVTNNSLYPLGIDRNGPIRPYFMLVPTVRSTDAPGLGELRPFIVNLGRRLRLMPRETLVIPVNMRNYRPAEVINAMALSGSIIKLRAFLNFMATLEGVAQTTLYGAEVEAPLIRVDGERLGETSLAEMTAVMKASEAPGRLPRMALISYVMAPQVPRGVSQEGHEAMNDLRVAFAEVFSNLDGPSQAWLLSVISSGVGPKFEGIQPILAIARKSEDRLVQLSYLLFHTSSPDDPMIDAARRSDDAALRRLAEIRRDEIIAAREAALRR